MLAFLLLKTPYFFPYYNDLTVTVLSVLLKKKKRVPDSFACREDFFKAFAIRERKQNLAELNNTTTKGSGVFKSWGEKPNKLSANWLFPKANFLLSL